MTPAASSPTQPEHMTTHARHTTSHARAYMTPYGSPPSTMVHHGAPSGLTIPSPHPVPSPSFPGRPPYGSPATRVVSALIPAPSFSPLLANSSYAVASTTPIRAASAYDTRDDKMVDLTVAQGQNLIKEQPRRSESTVDRTTEALCHDTATGTTTGTATGVYSHSMPSMVVPSHPTSAAPASRLPSSHLVVTPSAVRLDVQEKLAHMHKLTAKIALLQSQKHIMAQEMTIANDAHAHTPGDRREQANTPTTDTGQRGTMSGTTTTTGSSGVGVSGGEGAACVVPRQSPPRVGLRPRGAGPSVPSAHGAPVLLKRKKPSVPVQSHRSNVSSINSASSGVVVGSSATSPPPPPPSRSAPQHASTKKRPMHTMMTMTTTTNAMQLGANMNEHLAPAPATHALPVPASISQPHPLSQYASVSRPHSSSPSVSPSPLSVSSLSRAFHASDVESDVDRDSLEFSLFESRALTSQQAQIVATRQEAQEKRQRQNQRNLQIFNETTEHESAHGIMHTHTPHTPHMPAATHDRSSVGSSVSVSVAPVLCPPPLLQMQPLSMTDRHQLQPNHAHPHHPPPPWSHGPTPARASPPTMSQLTPPAHAGPPAPSSVPPSASGPRRSPSVASGSSSSVNLAHLYTPSSPPQTTHRHTDGTHESHMREMKAREAALQQIKREQTNMIRNTRNVTTNK
jgi:hypothetical protein